MASKKRKIAAAAEAARTFEVSLLTRDATYFAVHTPTPAEIGRAYDLAEACLGEAVARLTERLDDAGIWTAERAVNARLGWYLDASTGLIEQSGLAPSGLAPTLPPLAAMRPSPEDLSKVARMLDAAARGLLPGHLRQLPVSLMSADPDGHVRGYGRDLGDGPILWALVHAWHAIDALKGGEEPR